MPPLPPPTESNCLAARDIQFRVGRRLREASTALTAAANGALALDSFDLDMVIDAHVKAVVADRRIDALVLDLAAAAILGGASYGEVAARSGLSTTALTRHLPRGIVGLRGHHLRRDRTASHGWVAEG